MMSQSLLGLTAILTMCLWPSEARPHSGWRWPRDAVLYRDQNVGSNLPSTADCDERFFTQKLDHFSWHAPPLGNGTFQQRYFVYEKHWKKHRGPIFFYAGNEADVGLYVNHTGLMWENAERFGALLLFAEHRYWGQSCPFGEPCGDDAQKPNPNVVHLEFLTFEQVLADYASLILAFKHEHGADDSAVISFGGSLGGMLTYWLRNKYPHVVAGGIAASAPLRLFQGWRREWDSNTYWQTVTRSANATGGAAPNCSSNVRRAFDAMVEFGKSETGRRALTKTFRTCQPLNSTDDVTLLYKLQLFTFDSLAMGNYPYPSNYITHNQTLPAFPLRKACRNLAGELSEPQVLLEALSAATRVVTNASSVELCIPLPSTDANDGQGCILCDYYMPCTNGVPLETQFARDGVRDMFLPNIDPTGPLGGVNVTAIEERCQKLHGVKPSWYRMAIEYGAERGVDNTRNVFYSNGFLDPFSSGGITWMNRTDSLSVLIDDAAHHLDLMFSHPDDPSSVREVRKLEMQYIQRWINEWESATLACSEEAIV